MTRIALVIGSLRAGSHNRQLASCIAASLERHAEVCFLPYEDLPPMNQDAEWPTPGPVARVRAEVAMADGLWFVCPEYNGSYPGHVKNLIDWLSRPCDLSSAGPATSAIEGKRVTVSGVAGRSAARKMKKRLIELLESVGADVMAEPSASLARAREALGSDTLTLSPDDAAAIDEQADAFFAHVVGTPDVPSVRDMTSVPSEPSEGGVFARHEEIGSCSARGCSVDRS